MNIQPNNIRDLYPEFKSFFQNLDGANYIIGHEVILFSFSGDFNLYLKDLEHAIEPINKSISGNLKSVSFDRAQKIIRECLLCPWGPTQEPNTIEVFWKLINQYFTLPPTICYEHEPEPESCFDFGIQWNFCFILLNEQKQGIIIHAGAID